MSWLAVNLHHDRHSATAQIDHMETLILFRKVFRLPQSWMPLAEDCGTDWPREKQGDIRHTATPQGAFGTHLPPSSKELVGLGLLLEIGLLVFLNVTGLNRGSYLLEAFYWLPFLVYLLAVWRVSRKSTISVPKEAGIVILLFSLLFHATLLFSASPLSNDIYRYYWDGKAGYHGLNPYAYSPDSDVLETLKDSNWERVMNRDVHTMYPPLAQLVFAGAYAAWPGILSLRILSVLFSLCSAGLLVLILRQVGLDVRYSILYAWSPLVATEFANSGHIDSLAILFALLSFYALLRNRTSLSAAALALGVLSKIFPLLFAGLFIPRWGKKGTAVFVLVIAAFYIPFLGAGPGLLLGSSYFVDRGLFNGSLFPLVAAALEQVMWRPGALRVAKILVLGVFVSLFAILFLLSRHRKDDNLALFKYSFWLTGTFLLITPTLHPWYLTWILPFLCIFLSAPWVLLTGTVILARSVYVGFEATGAWNEIGWVRLAEYAPFYLLLGRNALQRILAWINQDVSQTATTPSSP